MFEGEPGGGEVEEDGGCVNGCGRVVAFAIVGGIGYKTLRADVLVSQRDCIWKAVFADLFFELSCTLFVKLETIDFALAPSFRAGRSVIDCSRGCVRK